MKTFVVALGGNALIKPGQKGTLGEQLKNLDRAVAHIVNLVREGNKVVITHGNGPQVGSILLQQDRAKNEVPEMPLYICVAESQGLIGYMRQDALYAKLHRAGIDMPVITLVTRVLVDEKDPAFKRPTKLIGPYRKLVPSPRPERIIEEDAVRVLSRKAIVIACGGGGVPVIKGSKGYEGVDAVIDKDLASARLACDIKADCLAILTDVPNVFLDYKKAGQKKIARASLKDIKRYYSQGHFPPGSMGPKIEASIRFLESGGKRVTITDFNSLEKSVSGKAGTTIS
jgi:carbamate kinase